MANPVVWFEVQAKDAKKTQAFFAKVFDWKYTFHKEMNYTEVKAGKGGIDGGIGQTMDGAPAMVTFYVQVDDPDAYLAKAKNAGGKVLMKTMAVPGGPTIAMFATPGGQAIGLIKTGSMQ
ncbi:MAG: VOC family protein [Chloroflexi bacterium]|nr:VOC family protein [Chloroflexota bacterium]